MILSKNYFFYPFFLVVARRHIAALLCLVDLFAHLFLFVFDTSFKMHWRFVFLCILGLFPILALFRYI